MPDQPAPSIADAELAISVNGTVHHFRLADATAIDARDCRRATGLGLPSLLASAAENPDIDIVAAIVWLARRQAGDRAVTFERVAKDIGYDADISVADDEGDDDSPS
jgi:hypothetical protein